MVVLIVRLLAVYLFVVGVAVPVQFLLTQFYDPTLAGAGATVWMILDPLMVVAMVVVLLVAIARKRQLGSGSGDQTITRDYLETNVSLYYSVALLIALLSNWFGFQFVDPANDNPLVWILIDVTVPLLTVSTAIRMWRRTQR